MCSIFTLAQLDNKTEHLIAKQVELTDKEEELDEAKKGLSTVRGELEVAKSELASMTARAKQLLRRSSIQSEAVPLSVQEAAGGGEGGSAAAKAEADELRARLVDSEAEWKEAMRQKDIEVVEAKAEASTALADAEAARSQAEAARVEAEAAQEEAKRALESSVGMEAAAEAAAQAMALTAATQAAQARESLLTAAEDEKKQAQERAAKAEQVAAEAESRIREAEAKAAEATEAAEELEAKLAETIQSVEDETSRSLAATARGDAAEAEAQAKADELHRERRAHVETTITLAQSRSDAEAARVEVREARETLDALQRRHDATLAELDAVKGSVRVFCRLRPLHSNEAGAPTTKPLLNATTDGGACRQVVVSPANATSRSFEFDRVFEPTASSSDVYDELRPLTRKVATGCSATILAYGQTGSGKTYTVNALHASVVDELLAVHKEEEGGAAVAKGGARLAVCMAEIYLDHVRDLGAEVNLGGGKADAAAIAPSAGMTSASAGGGVQNNEINLTWHHVTDASEAAARVSAATERRVTANNGINAHSSRSHLVVVYALLASDGERRGQLALVDLAGSERLTRTEATGERAKEAVAINKSLSGELATLRTRRAPLTLLSSANLACHLSSCLYTSHPAPFLPAPAPSQPSATCFTP